MHAYPVFNAALEKVRISFANPNGRAKRMAKATLRHGAGDPGTRARYSGVAWQAVDLRLDADGAIIVLTRRIRDERRRLTNLLALGAHPSDWNLEIAKEARLLARWLRRHRPDAWAAVLEAVTTPIGQPAPTLVVAPAPRRATAPARAAALVAAAG